MRLRATEIGADDLPAIRDALRNGPNCIRSIEAFRAAVEVLDVTGWAAYQEGGAELDGRRRANVWQVRIGDAG